MRYVCVCVYNVGHRLTTDDRLSVTLRDTIHFFCAHRSLRHLCLAASRADRNHRFSRAPHGHNMSITHTHTPAHKRAELSECTKVIAAKRARAHNTNTHQPYVIQKTCMRYVVCVCIVVFMFMAFKL